MSSERNAGETPRSTPRRNATRRARASEDRAVGQTTRHGSNQVPTGATQQTRPRTSASHAQEASNRAQGVPGSGRTRGVPNRGQGSSNRAQGAPARTRNATNRRQHAASTPQTRQQARHSAPNPHYSALQGGSHMNAQSVDFTSPRRSKRAARGEVRNVRAMGTSQKVGGSLLHPHDNKSFAQGVQRKSRLKRFLMVFVALLVVVGVGVGVGMVVFFSGLGSKFALPGQYRPTTLVAQNQDGAYYVLVVADLDASDGCDTDVDSIALVRVDPDAKKLALISVPTKISASLSDGSTKTIADAVSVGGYTELVEKVASMTGVSVSHFVKVDEAGIRSIVNAMGGLTLHLSEEVDDPNAGYIYIPAGQQTLNADQAMTFLRASNYREGRTTMEENQTLVIAMVAEYLSQGSQADTSSRLDGIAGSFQTDWSGTDLTAAFRAISGFQASNAYRDSVPCYATSTKDDATYSVYTAELATLIDNINSGNYTSGNEGSLTNINPSAYTVTVRNGSGITGGATTIANILSGVGFQIAETGNADSFVYSETLVIYGNETLKEAAQAAVGVLGVGRATEAGVYYAYDTDLLVILGSDWKPIS